MKKPYSVLIVDDDNFLLEMYKKKFESKGATVKACKGANECLDKIKEGEKPDILVCDIILPKMDGLELVEAIKKDNLLPDTIIVMLTNESKPETIQRARDLKVEGYIVKATSVPSEVAEEIIKIADNHTN